MTKPREKTREELQAEIEGGERRKSGSLKIGKRCCVRRYSKRNAERAATALSSGGAVFESIVPEAKGMTNEESATFLRLALTRQTVFYI